MAGRINAFLQIASVLSCPMMAADYHWNWRDMDALSYRDSLRGRPIDEREKAAIAEALAEELRPNSNTADAQEPLRLALDTAVRLVDLNADGVPEVIAQGTGPFLCAPVGNCPFWVLAKAGNRYRLILHPSREVQQFSIQKQSSGAYKAIILKQHSSATSSGVYVYEFKNGRYRPVVCFGADFEILTRDGNLRELKEPRQTRYHCDKDDSAE